MKKHLSAILIVSVCLIFSASVVHAGAKQRHRWQGVAMGIGAVILGKTLLDVANSPQPARNEVVYNRRVIYQKPVYHRPEPPRGHWQVEKQWIPPVTERVWNPGHYNDRGLWVSGRWEEHVVQSGHWEKQRIWVANDYRYCQPSSRKPRW